ncbi:hypothetical protein [Bradyrhizobium genosp. A]|uniref:hypothetical protein n=1 Tax=Bradyrhizobium genosp. A TaxID=83626 RepID=UPI003CE6BE19
MRVSLKQRIVDFERVLRAQADHDPKPQIKGGDMNRLQKFVEQGAYGERPGRIAYAFNAAVLPEPTRGLDWRPVPDFSPGDAILQDPGLKDVFAAAIKEGCAIATRGLK